MKEAFSLARNVVHCMEKPFNPNVLRAEVNKILSQQQGR
jgi:DNA-binding response OmpR family regulator